MALSSQVPGGEPLTEGELLADGIRGDRLVVRGPGGRVITSRTKPRLLGHRGMLDADGQPLVDGVPRNAPESLAAIRDAAGPVAQLVHFEGAERFDVLPLLVATDGAIAVFGRDGRRLRPNLVIGGVAGLAEREWAGKALRIGGVVIGLHSLRQSCVMTTFDPDTLAHNADLLRDIHRRFDGELPLNVFVIEPGIVCVGDPAELVS